MTHLQMFPYLRPSETRARVTAWQIQTDGHSSPLTDLLPDWDVATPIAISVTAEVDVEGIRVDCTLTPDDILRLALIWNSSGTGLRGCGGYIDLDSTHSHRSVTLDLQVAGAVLSDRIQIETQIVLPYPGKQVSQLAPSRPGSLLWTESRTILLEGQNSRFPTEIVDFAESGWLPSNAGWYLDWDPHDLHQTAMGSLRLFINSRHEKVRMAVTDTGISSRVIKDAIRFDVGRTMIMGVLDRNEFVHNPASYQEGSVGAVVRRLIYALFSDYTLESLQHQRKEFPFRFECRLQERFKLFQEV